MHKEHPDIQIYVGHVDRQLNENAYICPGLGEAEIVFLEQNNTQMFSKCQLLKKCIKLLKKVYKMHKNKGLTNFDKLL